MPGRNILDSIVLILLKRFIEYRLVAFLSFRLVFSIDMNFVMGMIVLPGRFFDLFEITRCTHTNHTICEPVEKVFQINIYRS